MVSGSSEASPAPRRLWRRLAPACALLLAAGAVAAALLTSSGTTVADQPVSSVAEYPHDSRAFCQGLVVHDGTLIESTGRYRESSLRRVAIESGEPSVNIRMDDRVFAEGVTVWNDHIIQLTWENGVLIVYDVDTFTQQQTVSYQQIDRSLRQGWGITHDNRHLIISDGSSRLRFVDPTTWKLVRQINVRSGFRAVRNLNELEYVNGEILANVWYSSRIARIDPESGSVIGWLQLKHLFPASVRRNREAVLNGIAWDADRKRLYVTGKLWPSLFEITYDGLPRPAR